MKKIEKADEIVILVSQLSKILKKIIKSLDKTF